MLEFSNDFFRQEEKCGFLVSEEMKHVWAAELEVLSEIVAVCDKYQITYFADYGTLLGAVRHKGFVPWDDDIDIALKRPDYNRLLQVLPGELPQSYRINSFVTEKEHQTPWASVANSKWVDWDEERMAKFFGCPYVVGVDIYPLDYLADDEELEETQIELYNAVYDLAQRYEELRASGEADTLVAQIEELCNCKLKNDQSIKWQLWRLSDKIAALATEEESSALALFPRIVYGAESYRLEKEWYEFPIKMSFENIEINVPQNYGEVLKVLYGDYKIPIREGVSAHEYPFYKNQKEIFRKMGKL